MPSENKPWLKSWPLNVPKTIKYPAIPLQSLLERTAKEYPQNIAITYDNTEITYTQLDSFSNKFANALTKLGIKKGDRVAIHLPNTPQFIIAYFGTLKAAAIVTPISPLNREREIEHQLNDSEAQTIITSDSLYPIVSNTSAKTKLKNIIVTNSHRTLKTISNPNKPNTNDFRQLLKEAPQKPPNPQINPQKDIAALQYTGGTTGTPKAAMLTHTNLLSNTLAFAAWIKGTPAKETFLTALPLFHIYGMTTSMNVPISLAAKIVLMPKFDSAKAPENIQKHKVTIFCGVPTMYSALLANPQLGKYDLTSIRICISGASPLPPQIQQKFIQTTGGILTEGYGLTEASPVTHCNPIDKTTITAKTGSIGLPLPNTNAKIVDTITGQKTLAPGEEGELALKGPQTMKGYWQKPDETAKVIRNGWLLTGDIARMDQDGYFYITDRKKDLIKYKDYSVYPREIEDILYENPAVKLCAVIGKPDPVAGEVPKAFITLKDESATSADEIIAFVNSRVASYKAIREVEFRKELPISSAGKVIRRLLHEEEREKSK